MTERGTGEDCRLEIEIDGSSALEATFRGQERREGWKAILQCERRSKRFISKVPKRAPK